MAPPVFTAAEARVRDTFLALMWALSYPGRILDLPDSGPPFERIAETLLDLETSYFTPDAALNAALVHSGARALPAEAAAYHFYPALTPALLAEVRQASPGTMLYPDEGATLMIGASLGSGPRFRLRGPGVNGQEVLQVGGLPDSFWVLRESVCRYPLGWDIFLLDGQRVVGLPRSTQVEPSEE